MNNKPLIISHAGCMDGLGALLAAQLILGKGNFETIIQKLLEEITYSYIRVNYPINNLTGIPSIEYLVHW